MEYMVVILNIKKIAGYLLDREIKSILLRQRKSRPGG
jgi:hypothetical protein